jgi:hypothetical protein
MKNSTVAIGLCAAIMSGCASYTDVPCYAEAGVGAWMNTTDAAENAGLIGDTPTVVNLYCTKGNLSFGLYHTSDIGRGRPFNNQREWSSDRLMINYRIQIN